MSERDPYPWHVSLLAALANKPGNHAISLGGWELSEIPLGVGAFGATFAAKRRLAIEGQDIFRSSAIKIINPEIRVRAPEDDAFANEVRALAELDSRFVAKLLDAGLESDVAWLATEYIEGANLRSKLLEVGHLDLEDWASLAEHLLRGLSAAHDVGLLHLDVKPANVMFSFSDSSYVLVDFGLARMQTHWGTRLNSFAGTLFYAAPEIFLGEYSPASDVFSLGTTLFESLTGLNPWVTALRNLELPEGVDSGDRYRIALRKDPQWSLLPPQVMSLVKGMIDINPLKRPTPRMALKELRHLSIPNRLSELEAVAKSNDMDATALFETWQKVKLSISRLINVSGIREFKLDVRSESGASIAFRVSSGPGGWILSCTTPKIPRNLIALGWRPSTGKPVLLFDLESRATNDRIAEVISTALESGYGLTLTEIQFA